MKKPDLLGFRHREQSVLGVMEALFLCLRELVRSSGVATILLFGVGRDYEFIDEEKESGGSGVMRSMPC